MSAWTIPSYAEWTVPGYTEERLLGHGVSGRVVEAVNDTTGKRVAIKYLDSSLAEDPSFSWEFRQQVEQLRSLDAAHMVRVFDYAEQPGQGAAIVMELIDGVSLREIVTRKGPLGTLTALVTLKDTLLGLAAAHSRRVAHRDVTPENVLVDAQGWCTVTDFGVAVKTDKHMLAAGTPAYMAPDLWNGSSYIPATDIYAATAVFCESLAGEPPFAGRPSQLRRQHESAPVPLTQYDQAVQDLIAWGMAKNPAERPRSARAFVHEIEARAAALYGPYWEYDGRRELAQRCAAVRPLLAGGGGASATATRMARRKMITIVAATGAAVIALGTVGVVALARTSASNTRLSSVETVADTAQTTVTPPVAVSRCTAATTFTYSGTITATIAGKVTYRWAYSTGKQGPVETLNFTAPGHQTVSGGTVDAVKASSGWGEIKLLSPTTVTSAKASYKLLCGTGDFGLTAAVQPAGSTVSSCGAAAPALTAT
ncbi:MAG TPA: serine/threonine-protein kinase, partial [Trebonia sp.]|nr:serine/threonine-protein kinase [Trebonia sp.]